MAVYVNSSTYETASSTTVVLDLPTSAAQYDLLLAFIARATTGAPSATPSGWTLVGDRTTGTDVRYFLYYKVVTASEPSSYTWTYGVAAAGRARAYVYRGGFDTSAPLGYDLLVAAADLTDAAWTKTRSYVAADCAADPETGAYTVDKLVEDGTAATDHQSTQPWTADGVSCYTAVVDLKMGVGERRWALVQLGGARFACYDLQAGVVGTVQNVSGNISALGGGWYRTTTVSTAAMPAGAQVYSVRLLSGDAGYIYDGKGHQGTAAAGGSTTTAVLAAGASATDGTYNTYGIIFSDAPTVEHTVTGYVGATRTATFTPARSSAPNGLTYTVGPGVYVGQQQLIPAAVSLAYTTSDTIMRVGSMTTTRTEQGLIYVGGVQDTVDPISFTPPSGWTEDVDSAAGTSGFSLTAASYEMYPSAGATGNQDVTLSKAASTLKHAFGVVLTSDLKSPASSVTYTVEAGLTSSYTGSFIIGTSTIDGPDTLGGTLEWTDISQYVERISIMRGRTDDLAVVLSSTCDIEMHDDDATFNPENPSSAFYGQIVPMVPLRVRATYDSVTYTLFTGYVQSWESSGWIQADDQYRCSIRAVDELARLGYIHPTYSAAPVINTPFDTVLAASGVSSYTCDALTYYVALPAADGTESALSILSGLTAELGGILYVDGSGTVRWEDYSLTFTFIPAPPRHVAQAVIGGQMESCALVRDVSHVYNRLQCELVTYNWPDSQETYGVRTYIQPAVHTGGYTSDNVYNWVLGSRYARTRARVALEGSTHTQTVAQLSLDLWDRVRIREADGVLSDYHIENITYTLAHCATPETSWYLTRREY